MLPEANYKIERTRRKKTIGLSVEPGRTVRVLVPKSLARSEIEALLYKKRAWIKKALEKQAEKEKRFQHSFQAGEKFFYLGKEYELRLRISSDTCPSVQLGRKYLNISSASHDPQSIQQALESWYAKEARRVFNERVLYFEKRLGLKHTRIKIKKLKSRWGSCNIRGHLVFNWLIVQAPMSILDLVVVHELCHLQEMNHSPAFWKLVGSVLPDYKARGKWLRQNGHLLDVPGLL